MKAREYAPSGPIEHRPGGGNVPPDERHDALFDALSGVPLGLYDERMLVWLASWDDSTVRAIVGLLMRAREAGAKAGRRYEYPRHRGLPTFEEIRAEAYRLLGDAAEWLRCDWSPVGSELTDEQAEGRQATMKHIDMAKAALNRAAGSTG